METLGNIAYNAFRDATRKAGGSPGPTWEELPEGDRTAWEGTAQAAAAAAEAEEVRLRAVKAAEDAGRALAGGGS